MTSSLVGSEMCIRDRAVPRRIAHVPGNQLVLQMLLHLALDDHHIGCLLYTSTLPTICSV
eukprot:1318333-Prorocentrum_lima.AAC.1